MPQHNIERRVFNGEVRAADGEDLTIQGTGAVFGVYADMGWHLEVNQAGAGDGADFSQCACLFNHDANIVLGRTHNGTLSISMDSNGMHYKAKLPDTQAARDAYNLVKGGYVHQSSYAFTIAEESWTTVDRAALDGKVESRVLDRVAYKGKVDVRSISKWGQVYDNSPVTYPAFKETTAYSDQGVALRSFMALNPDRAAIRISEDVPADSIAFCQNEITGQTQMVVRQNGGTSARRLITLAADGVGTTIGLEAEQREENTPEFIPEWKTQHYQKLTRLRELQAL